MRLGLIARADDRGLGLQSRGFYEHLRPDRVLAVDMGDRSPFENHWEWYPNARVARWDGTTGRFEAGAIDWLLDGCDVVLTAETPYDYALIERARDRGVKTVIQANHEFFRWLVEPDLPRPDLWISPSTWGFESWPEPKVFLPFPVDVERAPRRRFDPERGLVFLHVAGWRTRDDRNGTQAVVGAARRIRQTRILVRSQYPIRRDHLAGRRIVAEVGDIANHWDLYRGADVLVMPRRFGGQSLVINEAQACGLAVLGTDREPERQILPPEALLAVADVRKVRFQSGELEVHDVYQRGLAVKVDELAGDPGEVDRLGKLSLERADEISWGRLLPEYRRLLASL